MNADFGCADMSASTDVVSSLPSRWMVSNRSSKLREDGLGDGIAIIMSFVVPVCPGLYVGKF